MYIKFFIKSDNTVRCSYKFLWILNYSIAVKHSLYNTKGIDGHAL
jgi:hypothetical protein